MRSRFFVLSCVLTTTLLVSCAPADREAAAPEVLTLEDVELIPREALLGNPERVRGRISPNGETISFLAPVDGVQSVWVAPIGDVASARVITNDTGGSLQVGCRILPATPTKAHLAKASAAKPRVLASFLSGCAEEPEGSQDRRAAEGTAVNLYQPWEENVMIEKRLGIAALFCMVLVLSPAMVLVSTADVPGGSTPLLPEAGLGAGDLGAREPMAPIMIATGPDITADGYLEVLPDEYGSFGSVDPSLSWDIFTPLGLPPQFTTFSSGLFLFIDALERELLSDLELWQDILTPDTSLTRTVTAANVASDTTGNGVNDTLTSSFRVDGASTALAFDLLQSVSAAGAGAAVLHQEYTVTNEDSVAITFVLVRAYDGDLLWSGSFEDDVVGTTMHGAGLGAYVYKQEDGNPGTAVTVSGTEGRNYYGCKNLVEPPGGPPACGFGTDLQVWDAFGIPASWENFIANVGYNTNGESGATPLGDAGAGLDWEITLEPLESTTVTMLHTYGRNAPGAGPTIEVMAGSCPGTVTIHGTGFAADKEVGMVGAANTNGFTKGGTLCNGATFEVGEPFNLPPTFAKTDGGGEFTKDIETASGFCWVEALDLLGSCQTTGALDTE